LRDVFLSLKNDNIKSLKEITILLNRQEEFKDWEERKVLEYLNALNKFGLIDSNNNLNEYFFKNSKIGSDLTNNDIEDLKKIYFDYFRFKEISSWFVSPKQSKLFEFEDYNEFDYLFESRPLFFLNLNNKFTDTFLLNIDQSINEKFVIENKALMRFWDVYLKWGTTLGVLEKFNLSKVGYANIFDKEINIVYFIKEFECFDLVNFLEENFKTRHVWIPDLIFKIAFEFRYSVSDIKKFIVQEIKNNNRFTYERTSEIFIIKGKTSAKKMESASYLFPKINNSFISHLTLRK